MNTLPYSPGCLVGSIYDGTIPPVLYLGPAGDGVPAGLGLDPAAQWGQFLSEGRVVVRLARGFHHKCDSSCPTWGSS